MLADTKKPFDVVGLFSGERPPLNGNPKLWYVVTIGRGDFKFENVPAGSYRLIAHAWSGTDGLPEMKDTSETIFLHGVTEGVGVRADETTRTVLSPLGNGRLTLVTDPPAGGSFLLLSTAPPFGDPVLGPPGWGADFFRHVIGATHMSVSRATFIGLPDDCAIYAGLLAYDNSPGVGGGKFHVGESAEGRIDVYAGWSDGKFEPPAKLLPVVEYLEKNDPSLPELMRLGTRAEFTGERGRLDEMKLIKAIMAAGDKTVEVEGIGPVRVIDIEAAVAYRRFREHHRQTRERRNNAAPVKQDKPAEP